MAALSRSSGEVKGRSQASEQWEWLASLVWPCWLVLLVVSALVSSQFHSPILGCQSVVAPVCVASQPRGVSAVQGGSACGPSTLWRSEVAMLVVRRPSHMVARWSP
ncbi:hypothetical protein Taro_053923 [Colocasia esculenta]|uniref:Uncharacterized protein n=1 Tax=Colocasia esculenta TaxID=4460 RepID=A0A843XNZ5_COLES|nr:hypothetical protein [Colocasia esculenta]